MPIDNRPPRDPGDDYDEVMRYYLNDLVAHGWIEGWQPFQGDSILLTGRPEWGSGFTVVYSSALDYASGYFEAMHHMWGIGYTSRSCDLFPDGPPEYDADAPPKSMDATTADQLNELTTKNWIIGWRNDPDMEAYVLKVVANDVDGGAVELAYNYDPGALLIESMIEGIRIAVGVAPQGSTELPDRLTFWRNIGNGGFYWPGKKD